MPMTKDMKKYLKELQNRGYTLEETAGRGSGHVKILWHGRFVNMGGGGVASTAIHNLKASVDRFERHLKAEAERKQQLAAAAAQQNGHQSPEKQPDLGQCSHPGCPEPAVTELETEGLVCQGHLIMAFIEETGEE